MDQTETHIWVQTWLDYLATQGRSKHTLSAYRRAISHLANWSQTTYGELFDPAHLIARDIRDWKSYQQTVEQAAPSTINQRLVGVASFYKWAVTNNPHSAPDFDICRIILGVKLIRKYAWGHDNASIRV